MDGLYGKALISSAVVPDTDETWSLLDSKHPPPISPPQTRAVTQEYTLFPSNFDLITILRSFPKLSAAGPSGMRIQHLLDAMEFQLPTSLSSVLLGVMNLLAAGKAPQEVAIYLAGGTHRGSLTALKKDSQGKAMDVRPIALHSPAAYIASLSAFRHCIHS